MKVELKTKIINAIGILNNSRKVLPVTSKYAHLWNEYPFDGCCFFPILFLSSE